MVDKELLNKHLEFRKNNALTDGHIPKSPKQVLPDKLLNVLMYKFENEGEHFKMPLSEVRELLGLGSDSRKDNKRIIDAIKLLQMPIAIRDFTYNGREIKYISAPLLYKFVQYKDNQNFVEISISPEIVAGLIAKAGYTKIDLDICAKFKTKYGLKTYEMYLRYEDLPNRVGSGVGHIDKTLDELNEFYQTDYKTPSEMLRGINRGLKEIEKITGELITCFYDKTKKKFVFSWEQKKRYLKTLPAFINYIRKKYRPYHDNELNKDFYPTIIETAQGKIKVNEKGFLYMVTDTDSEYLDIVQAEKIWNWLYDLAKDGREF